MMRERHKCFCFYFLFYFVVVAWWWWVLIILYQVPVVPIRVLLKISIEVLRLIYSSCIYLLNKLKNACQ